MVVKVYADLRSQPCRALVIFLKNTEIPFEVVTINLHKAEHLTPEFANITPLKRVPAIQDGDFGLGETIAIIRYLTTKYADKVPDHWYPKDLEKRARVDEYLSWHHTGTRGGCCDIFVSEVLVPKRSGKPASEERIKREVENLKSQLDKLERVFLSSNKFLAGDEISVADILAVCEMMQNTVNGRDVTEGRPLLKAFVERVKAQLNPLFDEIHATMITLYK